MPQEDAAIILKPKFPQIIETYGASAQGDSNALLARKTIEQPTGSATIINRTQQEEARVDVIFPGIDSEEPNADGFTVSLIEKVREVFDTEEGKLLSRETWKQEPIGKIAPDDFPNDTARISSEWSTETWEYLNGVPIKREVIIRKPTIAVAGSYADFEKGEGLGLVPAEKIVESWVLQSWSLAQSKYLHIVQNFKTRGQLFPEYVAEWDNWTVGLDLCLDPSSPEPEIVSVAPEPITNDPSQPIQTFSEKKEIETYLKEDEPVYEPDQPFEPNTEENYEEEPTPDDSPPDPDIDYAPDSPPWDAEDFDNWDNPDEIYLDDAPEDADLERVAEIAAELARGRQFPYNITHPIRKVDITSYQPLRRVHVAGYAFVRDGFTIAFGSGEGGGKELAIAYTGVMIGKVNVANQPIPFYKKYNRFEDSVIISGTASLVDMARASASADSTTVLVTGVISSPTDTNYKLLCLKDGMAQAVEWMGTLGNNTYRVQIAPGANLLGQTNIFVIGWTQTPNTTFNGAVELLSFSSNTTFSWNTNTHKWLSFCVKTGTSPRQYRRGLKFHAGALSFYIYGR
ncbi:hypothetical protein [Floridanema evergladense]|uniref:Minor tail protein n=1 Tax=Floridaenema evergladense BLCC-F167 TaxID=3153639 RepID=A0ABV4WD90_9CYAN